MKRSLLAITLLALGSAAEATAGSSDRRMAVLILPASPGDAALADNLTEVAMARVTATAERALAARPGRDQRRSPAELVGTPEWRRHAGSAAVRDPRRCIQQPGCLTMVGASLDVGSMLIGVIETDSDHFRISLVLADIASNKVEGRFSRQVPARISTLIDAVQTGTDELLRAQEQPSLWEGPAPGAARTTPPVIRTGPAVSVPAGAADLRASPAPRRPPAAHPWAPSIALGSGIAAAVCLASGTLFEVDGQRRAAYGHLGSTLLVGGSVLSLVSAATFIIHLLD